jgi:hypothetical protein
MNASSAFVCVFRGQRSPNSAKGATLRLCIQTRLKAEGSWLKSGQREKAGDGKGMMGRGMQRCRREKAQEAQNCGCAGGNRQAVFNHG